MAELIQQRRVDDLAYQDGEEIDAAETIEFGLDGDRYTVDLAEANATRLRSFLEEFIAVAKPLRRQRGTSTPKAKRDETQVIRAWAREKGIQISDRGRIPNEVRKMYEEDPENAVAQEEEQDQELEAVAVG